MKTPLTAALVIVALAASGTAFAADLPPPSPPTLPSFETVTVHSKSVVLPVDISAANMKLSRAEYAIPVVKVFVPELAKETLLNHRDTGASAPCLATKAARAPSQVIQDNPRVENIEFHIEVSKMLELRSVDSEQVCAVTLIESVTAEIRGYPFAHVRYFQLPNRHPADCK